MPNDFTDKKLIIFDMDSTLTKSKSSIDQEMATLLSRLLEVKKVAIISGGQFDQFKDQIILYLDAPESLLKNLYILPTSGTSMFIYNSSWDVVYENKLTDIEKEKIQKALKDIFKISGVEKPKKHFGEIIEDRGSQITLSALGQKAPVEIKKDWDKDLSKRKKMKDELEKMIPDFDIHIGGTTSLDIVKKGMDKGYGVEQLKKYINIPIDDMLFIGDKLLPDGNDYPIIKTGIDWIEVKNLEDTKELIKRMI